jgi:excisionase family DNA binding protein
MYQDCLLAFRRLKMEKENGLGMKFTYTPTEISKILGISKRSAYNLCNNTSDFKTIRIGRSVRVMKESFDQWLGIS